MNSPVENKRNARQVSNINSLIKMNKETAVYESHENGAVQVVRYKSKKGKDCQAIWRDNKWKSVSHFFYPNPERMDVVLNEQIESSRISLQRKAEMKAAAKIKANIEIGDVVYTSWGYEQTNIDFYKVVGLKGKATAEYQKIGTTHVRETSWCSAEVKPDTSSTIGEIEKGRINQYGIKIGRQIARVTDVDSTHHASWGY